MNGMVSAEAQSSLNSTGAWILILSIFCAVCVFEGLGRKYGEQGRSEQP